LLNLDNAVLAIVDVQGKLAQLMTDKENLFANLQRMVKGAKVLGVPILWAEQNPAGLGPTITEVATLLDGVTEPFSKMSFSCMGSPDFVAALEATGHRQVLLTGIEAHICVYNTAADLLSAGYEVHVIEDAVGSRIAANKAVGVRRMCMEGAILSSTEMCLFEMMQSAEYPRFRDIQAIVK
jgi:nicotinamidase-related amidase